MEWPELSGNGRKIKKLPVTHGGRRRRFAGPIPTRPEAIGHEISRLASSGCPPPICQGACTVIVAGGASFGPISHSSQMVKMTQLGSTSFGELL